MSQPIPPRDRVPVSRVLPWLLLLVLLVGGLVLYFRYGTGVTPIADAPR